MDATIFDTSPNEALGFWPLMATWVSLKNSAYADTGFWGSLGSFFFFPFFTPTASADASVAGFPPPPLAVAREDGGAGWEDMLEKMEDEERDMVESSSTLLCVGREGETNRRRS